MNTISSLAQGQILVQDFAITKIKSKLAKNGDDYLSLTLMSPDLQLNGIVWEQKYSSLKLQENRVYKLKGMVNIFMGKPSLEVIEATESTETISSLLPKIKTIVFEISTTGKTGNEMDETAIHPLSGTMVSISMYNPESKKGMICTIDPDIVIGDKSFVLIKCESEKQILRKTWDTIAKYDRLRQLQRKRI
jgi:hypothetical protein